MYRSKRNVPVKVIDIKRQDGTRKAIIVFPYIHPGPFGTLGSSDLPARLQSRLNDLNSDLMVFHTTTTNSNNCAGESDIDSISDAVRRSLDHMDYVNTMSKFKKLTVGKLAIGIMKFGDFGIGSIIPEKMSFDDVSLKEGMKLIHSVEKSTLKKLRPYRCPELFSREGTGTAGLLNSTQSIHQGILKASIQISCKDWIRTCNSIHAGSGIYGYSGNGIRHWR